VASVEDQVSVLALPELTVVGLAVMVTVGRGVSAPESDSPHADNDISATSPAAKLLPRTFLFKVLLLMNI
jgi:hypothetical protein